MILFDYGIILYMYTHVRCKDKVLECTIGTMRSATQRKIMKLIRKCTVYSKQVPSRISRLNKDKCRSRLRLSSVV